MSFLLEILISFVWGDFEASEHPYILAFTKGIFIGLLMLMYFLFKIYFFNIVSSISGFEIISICIVTGIGIGIFLMLVEFIFSRGK
ncbi:MAG: hypothetical protein KA346_02035 [Neisseriaceae bacterium]|nr:hypothetical protein [Neisseriaceae bacterium]